MLHSHMLIFPFIINGNNSKGRAVMDEGQKSPENVLEAQPSGFGLMCTFLTRFLFGKIESSQLFSSSSAFDTEGNEWRVLHFISWTYTVQKLSRETDI